MDNGEIMSVCPSVISSAYLISQIEALFFFFKFDLADVLDKSPRRISFPFTDDHQRNTTQRSQWNL